MSEFKKGDTVRLKSGGPIMTIEKIGIGDNQKAARCVWFEGSNTNERTFELDTLKQHESSGSGAGMVRLKGSRGF